MLYMYFLPKLKFFEPFLLVYSSYLLVHYVRTILRFTKQKAEVREKRSHVAEHALSELLTFYPKYLVGAFLKKRARLLQSLVFLNFFYGRQTRSDER